MFWNRSGILLAALATIIGFSAPAQEPRPTIFVNPEPVAWLHKHGLAHGKKTSDAFRRSMYFSTTSNAPCGSVTIEATEGLAEPNDYRASTLVFDSSCKLPYKLKDRTIEVTTVLTVMLNTSGYVMMSQSAVVLDDMDTVYTTGDAIKDVLDRTLRDIMERHIASKK